MDVLFLEGLEVPCRVGCTDPERATPQSLRVGVTPVLPGLATRHSPTTSNAPSTIGSPAT